MRILYSMYIHFVLVISKEKLDFDSVTFFSSLQFSIFKKFNNNYYITTIFMSMKWWFLLNKINQ